MTVTGERAQFRRMRDGTAPDYAIIEAAEQAYFAKLPDRILDAVGALAAEGLDGYPVDRTEHSLQSATRAFRDGRETEYVVAALEHFAPLVREVFGREPSFPETAALLD